MIYLCDMKALYKLKIELKHSSHHGLFIEDKEKVEWLLKTKPEIYFGEISGKHSNVSGALDEDDIQMITDDPDELAVVSRLDLEHGINPFWYPTGDFEFVNEAYEDFVSSGLLNKTYEQTN